MTLTRSLLPDWELSKSMVVVEPGNNVKLLEKTIAPTEVPKPGLNCAPDWTKVLPTAEPKPRIVPALVMVPDTCSKPPDTLSVLPALIAIRATLTTDAVIPIVNEFPVPVPPMPKAKFPLSQRAPF